jgi:hypothetical protein
MSCGFSVDAPYDNYSAKTNIQNIVSHYPLSDLSYPYSLPFDPAPQALCLDNFGFDIPIFYPPEGQVIPPIDPTVSFYANRDIVSIVFPTFAATTNPLALARYYTFSRGLLFGVRFTSAKTQALINGDLSHALIHPAVVHTATLWGLVLMARSQDHPLDDAIPASYYNAAHASLLIPPVTRSSAVDDVQARAFLALYTYSKANAVAGRKWLREAAWTAQQAGLKITLPSRMSGVRDDVTLYVAATAEDQERDALCTLAYVDTGSKILLDTESHLDEGLQRSLTQLVVSVSAIDPIAVTYM